MILLLGAAFAQPCLVWPDSVARLVLVDGSASVERNALWQEQVAQIVDQADAVLVYDNTVHSYSVSEFKAYLQQDLPRPPATDLAAESSQAMVGKLSPALIVAIRQGERLRRKFAKVELAIVAPFLVAGFDAATPSIRALWPDPIVLHKVAAAENPAPAQVHDVVLHWDGDSAGYVAGLWQQQTPAELHNGIYSEVATLIAPFQRRWQLKKVPEDVTVIARWLDGDAAAVEKIIDGVRHSWLGFALPEEGDAVLRPSFVRFIDWLNQPARSPRGMLALADDQLELFAAVGNATERRARLQVSDNEMAPLTPWLLGIALWMLLAEPLLRRFLALRESPVVTAAAKQEGGA